MTKKTKNTLIISGVVLASIIVINKVRASNKMVTDESSGLFGLGILGIL